MSSLSDKTGGPAFAATATSASDDIYHQPGMSLRDYFAAAALANPVICTGLESERQIKEWFGERRVNIAKEEIVARQALALADAMIAATQDTEARHD